MRIPVAREGTLYCIIPILLGTIFMCLRFWILGIIFVFIAILVLLFFRYPDRIVKNNSGLVYAPADGRIVKVGEENEGVFFKDIVNKVSIFMSIFNVHINYAPISGVVEYIKYTSGNFKRADIAEGNENNFIGISNGSFRAGIRQVAGWIARRIVCDCKVGDSVSAGKRFGLIRFGSRVDVYMPKDVAVCVKIGDKVRAGRTKIGEKSIVTT